jgi:hypothetical protein
MRRRICRQAAPAGQRRAQCCCGFYSGQDQALWEKLDFPRLRPMSTAIRLERQVEAGPRSAGVIMGFEQRNGERRRIPSELTVYELGICLFTDFNEFTARRMAAKNFDRRLGHLKMLGEYRHQRQVRFAVVRGRPNRRVILAAGDFRNFGLSGLRFNRNPNPARHAQR